MSKLVILKTMAVSLLGIIFGYSVTQFVHSETTAPSRQLASAPFLKLGVNHILHDHLDMKIENTAVAENQDQTSLVQIKITALKNVSVPLNYQWILGKDVITSENLTGVLQPLAAGESHILELRVQKFSKEWQSHVSLSISGEIAGQPAQREVIVSSRPEDSFEYVVQQAALAEQNSPNESSKQIQKASSNELPKNKFRKENIIR